jgi:ABC-2 type transport system ATP-binding protein
MTESSTPRPQGRETARDPTEAVVRVRGLRMAYGRAEVLAGVDLTVLRGEVVALLGPNGAGKSTTIEILEGFRTRTSGDVRVLGQDPHLGDEAWRARIGIVLQSWRDHEHWTVAELLRHIGDFYPPYSAPGRPRPRNVDELTAEVGLTAQRHQRVGTLSGGQRRRLDIAIGVLGNPELLFLDEPTAGFDPSARHDFHDLIRSLAREDTAILLTTHDLDEAERVADRVLILDRGRIVADGTPSRLAASLAEGSVVRWRQDGEARSERVEDSTGFIRRLLAEHGEGVTDIEVVRAGLEAVYLELTRNGAPPDGRRPADGDGGET